MSGVPPIRADRRLRQAGYVALFAIGKTAPSGIAFATRDAFAAFGRRRRALARRGFRPRALHLDRNSIAMNPRTAIRVLATLRR